MPQFFLVSAAAYAIGCIVGAYYIVRLRHGGDIRATGSGNAGARNVFRSGDATGALLTFGWDALKGAAAVWLSLRMSARPSAPALAFMFVTLGHICPVQLGFRGGKGVATAIGCTITIALLARSWPAVIGAAVAWMLVAVAHQPIVARHRELRAQEHGA